MSDPKARLRHDDILAAGLDDWRKVLNRLKARFRTGDFATGLTLVDRIGAAAEEAGHHPDVTLTYPEVVVTLSSHDVGGITSRDLDLARRISELAAELGAVADVSGLTEIEPALDTASAERLGDFYAALLGAQAGPGGVVDPSGQVPGVWFQTPDGDGGAPLPERDHEQRWHLDVWVPHDEAERRLQAVLDAGGRLVSDADAPAFWVVEDADGNRSCICTPLERG
ncbi:4a-hydroxytetrahydrobiopterin dehydratase [Nocardioides sp. zg-1228]|uniref:4a-hydroxytetrahydrobiopterin dehydratase n=1 Tax=Nocardioides sp. zg-1228 TaxID=2763008 RepID=UPI0016433B32|nr:4a-hydroxytetrahydrobiopterin dehydratase [Nocardioides sp. zg-1228]MBC2933270.1 4a-hydroxytetrahydrobiopterin dehydratase [Nocardioides sp. zg-1228]QSF56565.1 4a-hydroxytetrahydrobiopterin dehydratase [Nocardioides sp. zg-1228]